MVRSRPLSPTQPSRGNNKVQSGEGQSMWKAHTTTYMCKYECRKYNIHAEKHTEY